MSVASANWLPSRRDVARFCTWYGPPVADVGRVTRNTIVRDAPAASGPESGTKLPSESVSGVTPSAWNSEYDVPGGNVLAPTVMANTSLELPGLVSTLGKAIVAPWVADGTIWPVNVSEAAASTTNGARFVGNGPTFDTPSL